jgi:TPR repeat protein
MNARFSMKVLHTAAAVLLATLASQAAYAATAQDGWTLYDQANYSKAAEVFRSIAPAQPQVLGALCEMAAARKAASTPQQDLRYCQDAVAANDPQGLVTLGRAHLEGNAGLAVEKNETLGLGYLGMAVAAGYPVASNVLCVHYYRGAEFARATPFCKVAAAARLPAGLHHLALMSMEGKGAVQDFDKGRKFALLAASLGNPPSFVLLGDIANGGEKGHRKDPVAAYAWYALAAAAAPDWDQPVTLRDGIGLDGAKVAQAQKMAASWKTSAAVAWRSLYPAAAAVAPAAAAAPAAVAASAAQ